MSYHDEVTAAGGQKNYRKKKMKEGVAYERRVHPAIEALAGRKVRAYIGKNEQLEYGENDALIEIKNDQLIEKYGRLFLEIAEKASERDGDPHPSGIYATPSKGKPMEHYLQGDEKCAWLFWIKDLQGFLENIPSCYKDVCHKKTVKSNFSGKYYTSSIGWSIPVFLANRICQAKIHFRSEDGTKFDIVHNEDYRKWKDSFKVEEERAVIFR